MLLAVMYRKQKKEIEAEESAFERDLFINNPSMYQEYLKQKEEDASSGNDGITWVAPESVEEARELMNIFADVEKQLNQEKTGYQNEESSEQSMSFIDLFNGINIDEIGK